MILRSEPKRRERGEKSSICSSPDLQMENPSVVKTDVGLVSGSRRLRQQAPGNPLCEET